VYPHWLHRYPTQWNGMVQNQAVIPEQPPQPPWWVTALAVTAVGGLIYAVVSDLTSKPERVCGSCGRPGHDRRICAYDMPRVSFSRAIPKSRRCECCGLYGHRVQRHHPRGRANTRDFLDVCDACHVNCGHEGHFRNLAIKPRICRVMNRPSFWCN
jgi:hypothetical protein